MPGVWSNLKRTLLLKSSGKSASSSQLPPRVSEQSDSRSPAPGAASSANSSSASLSSCFSRSFSSGSLSTKKACAICLGSVASGKGQALFTAECSHLFHFSCIANNVKHGNYHCPICRSNWKEIPCQHDANHNASGEARVSPNQVKVENVLASPAPQQGTPLSHEPSSYSDDEPLAETDSTRPASCALSKKLSLKAFTEFPAVAAAESVSDFSVVVSMRAPSLLDDACQVQRAPIDLVTVLDVSGSMGGSKLHLLKHAVCFVIDNLGPANRLSIVSFSDCANRIFPLRKMTDRGREDARVAVNSLCADGGTNIIMGLKKGTRVLDERRERNPVAGIILLSDGKDTYNCNLLRSLCPKNRESKNDNPLPTFPVHAFGVGADHDSAAMHAIANTSGGTFSFVESVDMMQDAFARCIGGLLSVVAQQIRLTVTTISLGVKIDSIPSGDCANEISDLGFRGVIHVGDLYAEEAKEFLIGLSVPVCPTTEDEQEVMKRTSLLHIMCSYWDTISKSMVQFEGERVEICRPTVLSPEDTRLSLEIDRQKNRLLVVEDIALAKDLAERGNLEDAKALLTNRLSILMSSASAQSGDGICNWLQAELMEISKRMKNMQIYETTGRAYVLSGLSSHSSQRATTRGSSPNNSAVLSEGGCSGDSGFLGYNTPSMVSMVSKSQELRFVFSNRERVDRQNKSTGL